MRPNARKQCHSEACWLVRITILIFVRLISPAFAIKGLRASDIQGDQMSVLTVAGQKGGSGKTNLVRTSPLSSLSMAIALALLTLILSSNTQASFSPTAIGK